MDRHRPRKINELDLSSGIQDEIVKVLTGIPFIKRIEFDHDQTDRGPDIVSTLLVGAKTHTICVEIKTTGQPKAARSVIASSNMWRTRFEGAYFIFAAPFISESSRALCKEAGIGYIDLTGNCFISFSNFYIDRFGFEKQAESRQLKSVFNEKASRVVRRLLKDPGYPWHVLKLAQSAQVSTGLASQVKTKLLDSEILEQNGETYSVRSPATLIQQWSLEYQFTKHKTVEFYSSLSLQELEKHIAQIFSHNGIDYAFTLATAARLTGVEYAKGVNRIHSYVLMNPRDANSLLGLKEVESGGNVILMQPFDDDILYDKQEINGITIVSNIQLFLDFSAQKGRVKETADVILGARINRDWKESIYASDESE